MKAWMSIFIVFAMALPGTVLAAGCDRLSTNISVADDLPRHYGETVTFNVDVDGRVGKNMRLFIMLSCSQNEQVVYIWPGSIDMEFPLIDQGLPGNQPSFVSSIDAACTASLMCRDREVHLLNQVEFPVIAID